MAFIKMIVGYASTALASEIPKIPMLTSTPVPEINKNNIISIEKSSLNKGRNNIIKNFIIQDTLEYNALSIAISNNN
jgi:hypothetical protein